MMRTVLLAVCSCVVAAEAQDNGYWKPMSTTARSITGDISISAEKLTMNFSAFTIADIRTMTANESASVFPGEPQADGAGKLYRLNIPAKKTFLRRNTLCGAEDTQWMATYASRKTLQTAFFSGTAMPVFAQEAVSHSTALCGTFAYTR